MFPRAVRGRTVEGTKIPVLDSNEVACMSGGISRELSRKNSADQHQQVPCLLQKTAPCY